MSNVEQDSYYIIVSTQHLHIPDERGCISRIIKCISRIIKRVCALSLCVFRQHGGRAGEFHRLDPEGDR